MRTPDFWRCVHCGCLWRLAGALFAVADAKQIPCVHCERARPNTTFEPLYRKAD